MFSFFFGVFKHDKLVQVRTESFKQNSKINPVLEPDNNNNKKRGKNIEENRLATNLQHLKQKLNLWHVPLKSSGSKYKEGGGDYAT